jgi:hypothetical protein
VDCRGCVTGLFPQLKFMLKLFSTERAAIGDDGAREDRQATERLAIQPTDKAP